MTSNVTRAFYGCGVVKSSAARPATARDLAVNAAVLGVAAMVWFGWAQEAPPAGWSVPLGIGSVLGVLIAFLAGRHPEH